MTTFVLVHGAWADGWIWHKVAERLDAAGHEAVVIDRLPSAGTEPGALGDLAADAAHVRGVLDGIDGQATVVGHSYGGMVVTEVADHPNIEATVYLAAFWPGKGQSLLDLSGDSPPPEWQVINEDGTASVTTDLETAHQALFADIDVAEAAEAHSHLGLQSLGAFVTPSTAPARTHPTTYIVCSDDEAISPAAQEAMAQQADRVEHLRSSHCPMFSMPDALVKVLATPSA